MGQGKKLFLILILLFVVKYIYAGNDITFIFISSTMPEKSITKILKQVDYYSAKNKRIGVFLSGFIGDNLKSTVLYIYHLMKKANTDYGILIYPQYFKEYKIKIVPTFIRLIDNKIIKMTGDTGLDFFLEKSNIAVEKNKNQKVIDLGCWGPIYPIKEKDLKILIKEKLKKINIKNYVENARKNIFKNIKTSNLKRAKKNYNYFINMSVILDKDIYSPDGKLIYRAGTVLNPLEKFIYDEYFVFFNAKDLAQIQFVKNLLKKDKSKKYLLLVTDFDKSDIQALAKLRKTFNHSVYIAYPFLIKKFNIKNLPAVAHQKKNLMQIKVFALLDKKKNKNDGK